MVAGVWITLRETASDGAELESNAGWDSGNQEGWYDQGGRDPRPKDKTPGRQDRYALDLDFEIRRVSFSVSYYNYNNDNIIINNYKYYYNYIIISIIIII